MNNRLSSSSTVSSEYSAFVSSASSQPEDFTTFTSNSGAAPILSPIIQSDPHLVYVEGDIQGQDDQHIADAQLVIPMHIDSPPSVNKYIRFNLA
ncbi:hypothetical protein L2E82_45125 [Cichorium intybus]|uniref:Uncharacterized protein n=1 Tax=Cichorium intybus TaxID=13427 RepID=A0ACB8ZWJ2_CICIN|nr:hypothetical protein L2E82_45125 [Cichorium intybus]